MSAIESPQVCIVGLGYIGLPTAAVIARSGMHVLGIDISQHVVDTINRGEIHIEEVDLDALVQAVVRSGTLRAATVVGPADVFVIAVPTPFAKDGRHTPDISYVLAATREVAKVLKPGDTVILESTSPIGTTEEMRDLIAAERSDLALPGLVEGAADIAIAYCPERVATVQQDAGKGKRRMRLGGGAERERKGGPHRLRPIPLSILTLCARDQG